MTGSGEDVAKEINREDQRNRMRERYVQERELRRQAPRASRRAADDRRHEILDPFSPVISRESVREDVDVVIVGAGFAGMLAAVRLKEHGIDRIRFVESAGDFGGTWYWNRYPGAACDVESYIYMPLLEELGYVPKQRYASAPEIFAHAQAIGRHFGLYELAHFQTNVVGIDWQEEDAQWQIRTNRGDEIRSRFVVLATGFLSAPKLSAIPGLERFRGTAFHTSRWMYSYTGGDQWGDDRLVNLRDKVVGIVGTGATAVQAIPKLAEWAKHLYVFQRTPAAVAPRRNAPTDPAWVASLEAGWQERRIANFTNALNGVRADGDGDIVADEWTALIGDLLPNQPKYEGMPQELVAAACEDADIDRMLMIHDRIDSIVSDEETAQALKPYYFYMCKRPCFHDEYLQTFNRTNVTLVNAPHGVEEVNEHGVVAEGAQYDLDCLVYSTGFENYHACITEKSGFDVIGRRGSLREKWSTEGLTTLHGIATSGFPNMFFMPLPFHQSGGSANNLHPILEGAAHIAWIIGTLATQDVRTCDVDPDAEKAWTLKAIAMSEVEHFFEQCTPGHFNNDGKLGEQGRGRVSYSKPLEYFEMLRSWRESGDMAGLSISPSGGSVPDAEVGVSATSTS